MAIYSTEKGKSEWRESCRMRMARSAESFPPDRQTAILSPGAMRRYSLQAETNGAQISFRYVFSTDCIGALFGIWNLLRDVSRALYF